MEDNDDTEQLEIHSGSGVEDIEAEMEIIYNEQSANHNEETQNQVNVVVDDDKNEEYADKTENQVKHILETNSKHLKYMPCKWRMHRGMAIIAVKNNRNALKYVSSIHIPKIHGLLTVQ